MRRGFSIALFVAALCVPAGAGASSSSHAADHPGDASAIAITFDDLPVVSRPGTSPARRHAVAIELIEVLRRLSAPVIGFANGDKLLAGGSADPDSVALLDAWLDAGLSLGSHTFSHADLHGVGVAAFEEDIRANDDVLRPIAERHHQELRYFRHPYLHTGRSAEDRAAIERFLAARGYRVAPVTIDDSDWIFARAYDAAVDRGDTDAAQRVRNAYVPYMLAKVDYYDDESRKLFGRHIPQVLLVHASALNAAAFAELARALRERGHEFVALERALGDPAYRSPDAYFGAGGISWLDRWALTRGVQRGFFRSEPRTPRWIMDLAGVEEE